MYVCIFVCANVSVIFSLCVCTCVGASVCVCVCVCVSVPVREGVTLFTQNLVR